MLDCSELSAGHLLQATGRAAHVRAGTAAGTSGDIPRHPCASALGWLKQTLCLKLRKEMQLMRRSLPTLMASVVFSKPIAVSKLL